jgi:hypothetical protein
MAPLTFRSSKIVYYGPHSCENCGALIVKMGSEFGGSSFTNPEGPIYPNTEWHPHVCDPALVRNRKGLAAQSLVTEHFPMAHAVLLNRAGFLILGESGGPDSQHALVVSMNSTYYGTANAAWCGALERLERQCPTWHTDLTKYGVHSGNSGAIASGYVADGQIDPILSRLPQCPA